MSKLIFTFLLLVGAREVFCQSSISGHVYCLNSKYETGSKVPAVNVQVRGEGSNGDYSQSDGAYTLRFDHAPPGKAVVLGVGNASNIITDGKGIELELVNATEIGTVILPNNSLGRPLEIIVCPKGYRDLAARKYYKTIKASADLALAQKEKEFRALLEEKEKDYSRIEELSTEFAKLQRQADSLSIYKEALSIASINRDDATGRVLHYLQLLDEEKSIQEARVAVTNREAVKKGRGSLSQFNSTINELETRALASLSVYDYADAITQYDEIIKFSEEMNIDKLVLSKYYSEAGNASQIGGQNKKALTYHQKSISIHEETLDPKHPDLAVSYNNMGIVYNSLGDYHKALEYHWKSEAIREETLDPKHPDLATSYDNIALTHHALGDYEKALEFSRKSTSILEEILSPKHPDLASSYNSMSMVYRSLGDYPNALEYDKKALAIRKEILDPEHPHLAISYADIGLSYYYLSDHDNAIDSYKSAVLISPKFRQQDYYNNIGMAYAKNGQFVEAEAAFTEFEKLFPKEGRSLKNWAMFYALQNDKEKSLENLHKAVKLGYSDLEWLKTDESMDNLRDEGAFLELIRKLENDHH